MHFHRYHLTLFALLASSILTGCGSGGSGDNLAGIVEVGNRAPIIVSSSQSPGLARLGEAVNLNIEASDADGDALTFIWTASDGKLASATNTANSSSGQWTAPMFDGSYTVTVQVSDGSHTTSKNFTYSALAANTRKTIETYLVQRAHNSNGLLQTYDALAGQPGLENRHDVYDSALVAVFLSAQGNQAEARRILDGFVTLSTSGTQLLSASYDAAGLVNDWRLDTGNNAYAIIALMQYVRRYGDVNGYDHTARGLMSQLSTRLCAGALAGYHGEDTVFWRSIEHNVDMYAAAQLLGDATAKSAAQTFVQNMWVPGAGQDRYNIGTTNDAPCTDNMAWVAVPTDAQTWTMLSLADDGQARKRASMNWAAANMYRTDVDENGDAFAGFLFTNGGTGIQLEITASGAMALATYLQRFGASDPNRTALSDAFSASRATVFRQLNARGYVPATVLPQVNTGLGLNYFRTAHVAATAWTGLLAGYAPGLGPVNEAFNPYSAAP